MRTALKFGLTLILSAFLLSSCELIFNNPDPDNEPDGFSGSITKPTTWASNMVINGTVTISADLTIEPGTTISFTEDGRLEFGYYEYANLTAIGTANKPIIFKSTSSNKWEGIAFYSHCAKNAQLKNCIIHNAGTNNCAAIEIHSTSVSIDSCSISGGDKYAFELNSDGNFKSFTYNNVSGFGNHFIRTNANSVNNIDGSNVFTTLGNYGIYIYSSDLNTNSTWQKQSVPYYVEDINIDNAELTILPGATFKFTPNSDLEFGYYNNAKLTANGTEDEPITFASAASSPAEGDWDGLYFYSHCAESSSMEYCNIAYAGSRDNAAININDTKMTVNSCTISEAQKYAIELNSSAKFVECKNNTFINCGDHLIRTNANAVNNINNSNIFSTNGNYGIYIYGSDLNTNSTWQKQSVPYYVEDINIDNAELTILPGATLKFTPNSNLEFGYYNFTKFIAIGTANEPITFTSAASSPSEGDWDGLHFYSNIANGTIMEQCHISYTGSGNYAAITMSDCGNRIKIRNSIIDNNSADYDIYLYNSNPTITNVVNGYGMPITINQN